MKNECNLRYEDNKIRNAEVQRKLLESRKTEEMQSRNAKEYKEALAREAYDIWLQIKVFFEFFFRFFPQM